MPHKLNNFTDSSPSSPGSSNEQLNVAVVPGMIDHSRSLASTHPPTQLAFEMMVS
jgi:hypothetical protein